MKYCSECGAKLNEKKIKKEDYNLIKKTNKRSFIISAGILLIIAASLCIVLGTSAILDAKNISDTDYYDFNYNEDYSYHWAQFQMKLFLGAVSLSAFTIGLISALLILKKTFFTLVLLGIFNVNIASLLSIGNNIGMFLLIGLPIFILSMISMVFVIHSKNKFN